ncbi:MAG: isochorismatase family protein [Planctomycetes bacterium]|nr:isochorismatase family protein [Planctomycetota bacterium]
MKPHVLCVAAMVAVVAPALSRGADPPLRVVLVSGSAEYESDRTLAGFERILEEGYEAEATLIAARGMDALPGLEALDRCDVALFFTRRLNLRGDGLERIRRYAEGGGPIVAVRTASHGFQTWLAFDGEILGGNYQGHCGPGMVPERPTIEVKVAPAAKDHPVLAGVGDIRSRATLYKNAPIAEDAEVLMVGRSSACPDPQPVTWTRIRRGARIVYTSLGEQNDFENAAFRRLLANALFWASGREVARRPPAPIPPLPAPPAREIALRLRTRVETFKGSGIWDEVHLERKLPAARAAILVCDMWNRHWCRGATERVDAMAPRMNAAIGAAREAGIRIIHAPSETMGFYADRLQRRRMQAVPRIAPPAPLALSDPALPIDASDGGCDTDEKPWYMAWTRQHPAIEMGEFDGISDDGREVYAFLRGQGIDTLLLMGVHTNMCVLGRSFGIRQMTRWGIRCILVRDLTDTMYDPKDPPHVPHEEGTELVVRHIEKYWCPSILSEDLLEGLDRARIPR